MIDELREYPVERLFLRIACRTAEWPEILENGLKELWGEEAVGIYQLAPLRYEDVKVAAQSKNIDTESLLKKIKEKELQPLAIKPVTLEFLLNIFQKKGNLPGTQTELYLNGCRLLCEEVNPNRRGAGFRGSLSAEQRLVVASRIAALTMFANRSAISTTIDTGDIIEEYLPVKDFCIGYEDALGERFRVNEKVVNEVLTTGLFVSRGPHRMGWFHQTYAEFLAAWYLHIHKITTPQIMSLITHPGDKEGKLIPQLYETASWLASMNPEIFREIMKVDPEILLKSDVATVENNDRKQLVENLLKLFNEEKLHRYYLNGRIYYKKFSHPGLEEQLLPYLKNRDGSISARIAAIKIVHYSEVQPLYTVLADIALNSNESIEIRGDAAYAISQVGDENSRSRLKPLALKKLSEDTNDDLKGNSLLAVWPEHITAVNCVKKRFRNPRK